MKKIIIIISAILVVFLAILVLSLDNKPTKINTPKEPTPFPTKSPTGQKIPTPTIMMSAKQGGYVTPQDKEQINKLLLAASGFSENEVSVTGYYVVGDWTIASA